MFELAKTAQVRGVAKWCACALLLLAPGSFVVLPLLWLARHWTARGAAFANLAKRGSAKMDIAQSSRGA
jgi:hypothetical protein